MQTPAAAAEGGDLDATSSSTFSRRQQNRAAAIIRSTLVRQEHRRSQLKRAWNTPNRVFSVRPNFGPGIVRHTDRIDYRQTA